MGQKKHHKAKELTRSPVLLRGKAMDVWAEEQHLAQKLGQPAWCETLLFGLCNNDSPTYLSWVLGSGALRCSLRVSCL